MVDIAEGNILFFVLCAEIPRDVLPRKTEKKKPVEGGHPRLCDVKVHTNPFNPANSGVVRLSFRIGGPSRLTTDIIYRRHEILGPEKHPDADGGTDPILDCDEYERPKTRSLMFTVLQKSSTEFCGWNTISGDNQVNFSIFLLLAPIFPKSLVVNPLLVYNTQVVYLTSRLHCSI